VQKNFEIEEKQKLFQSKIKELELLFQHESLDKLKELSFIENGQEITTGIKLVGQGDEEGRSADSETQEQDD
jgi:hypothetical protein